MRKSLAAWVAALMCTAATGCRVNHSYTTHLEYAADSDRAVVTYFSDGQYVRKVVYRPLEASNSMKMEVARWQQSGLPPVESHSR